MKKNILAIILALCMVIAMLPATVFAAHDGEQLQKLAVPETIGKLEPAAVEPNAKSYSVSLTGGSNGETELLVSSPAEKGSEVYFLANPDEGYLAEIYFDGLDAEDFVYIGMDIWGFIMPGNKVTLEVNYVEAEGEEHDISVYPSGTAGEYALERSSAKQYESVLLAIYASSSDFHPTELVWAYGADIYYLFEEDSIHYFEIIMGDEDVQVLFTYSYLGAHKINYQTFISNGDVTADVKSATTGKEVFLYATPDSGYYVDDIRVKTEHGGILLDVNYVREEQGTMVYSFIMPPSNVTVYADFRANTRNVTVKAGPGGTASANVTEAKVGSTVTITCTPDEGYRLYSITGVDGIVDKGNNVYEFVMPDRDVVIDVTFRKIYNPITVTVDTGLGGTASADLAEAKAGDIVTLTCTPEEGYRMALISGIDGCTDNGDGTYTFVMPDGPADVHVLFLRHENPFVDVNEKHFFYESVLWAVGEGITNGIDASHFGPYQTSNRAAVVTMLWRWAGSPEPTTTENPFTDVPDNVFYSKSVLWAVENGITNGLTATTFGPGEVCNRAQVVTFLYRYLKTTVPEGVENPFVDVPAGSWYEAPVLWALANGVTTGADATHFDPNGQCLRAQFVTFLYRTSLIPPAPAAYELHWVINGFQDTPSSYGTVTLSHEAAEAGETITAAVVPAEGYVIDWVKCEFGTELTQVSDTEYTFVMPDHAEVFHVNFVEAPAETEPTEPTA